MLHAAVIENGDAIINNVIFWGAALFTNEKQTKNKITLCKTLWYIIKPFVYLCIIEFILRIL